jgi:hypothetical protein
MRYSALQAHSNQILFEVAPQRGPRGLPSTKTVISDTDTSKPTAALARRWWHSELIMQNSNFVDYAHGCIDQRQKLLIHKTDLRLPWQPTKTHQLPIFLPMDMRASEVLLREAPAH